MHESELFQNFLRIFKSGIRAGLVRTEVLQFIAEFRDASKELGTDDMGVVSVFTCGYCYYFAVILKTAFNRGRICIADPYDHIVWVDDNGTAYDIDGVNYEWDDLLPIDFSVRELPSFMHVPQ